MRSHAALVLTLLTFANSQTRAGFYARSATPVWQVLSDRSGHPRTVRIPAPSGPDELVAMGLEEGNRTGVQLTLQRGGKAFWTTKVMPGVGIEIAWAPGSHAFFVTSSNAGLNGGYQLSVYFLNGTTVTHKDVTPVIYAAFGHPMKCGWTEDPNVAAVKWVTSARLIVAAEIVNHSNCDSYGTFRAYEVAVPEMRILKSFGQMEAKRLFARDLGEEIKNAPDDCVRRPRSCWVESNHVHTPAKQ